MTITKRHGEYWEHEEYEELIDRVLAGETEHAIARALSRTPSAIRSRVRWLLSLDGTRVSEGGALDRLADRLDTPGFDWEALLSEHARAAKASPTPSLHRPLSRSWTSGPPIRKSCAPTPAAPRPSAHPTATWMSRSSASTPRRRLWPT